MIFSELFTVSLAASLATALCVGGVTVAQDTEEVQAREASSPTDEVVDEATASVQDAVDETTGQEAAERRKKLIDDAVEALGETQKALKALDEKDAEMALESLATATGKLDLVVARNPKLALAAVDVRVVKHDLHATVDSIEEAKRAALKHMKKGRLQAARALLEDLRSDVVVEVVSLPLATYPAAIRAISPLIDDGKIAEAKTALQQALSTLVITEHVHALPVLRAEHMLARAEELAETKERSDEQEGELSVLLSGARRQLELARALGYGLEEDFEAYYEQLDLIAEKTSGGKSGSGFFDKIRSALSRFGESRSS